MDKTSKLFDVWAKSGRSEDMEKGHGTTVNQFLDKLSIKENFRFLDIGCGTGEHTLELLKKGYKVTGVDLSNEMLKIYQKYVTNNEQITKEELEQANKQFSDLLKGLGLAGVFALPGGLLAIAFIVKVGEKLGIEIIPEKYKK